ncbi:MAG: cytosine permease [Thermodesulfobacteriota bacterium]
MLPERTITPKGYQENPDLLPTPTSQQTYNSWTFTLMMFSMNTCIPMFFLGPIGSSLGLNLWQALVGAFIGNLAAVLVMWMNGQAGVKYGITFPVQLRESFGFKGIHVPIVLRGLAGTVWFGVEAYAGSLALMMIFFSAFVPTDQVTPLSIKYLLIALVLYLGSFIVVMRYGLKGIGSMANWAGPLMLLYFIWLVYFLASSPQFAPNIPKMYVSKAGYFSLNFLTYLAVQTNWWATVALNVSDLSRGINPEKPQAFPIGLFIGIVVCQVIGTALGFAAVALTGTILPQDIILKYAPGGVAVVIGLLFAFLAPWSTDITANSPPLINILMATFKLRWKLSVVLAGIIAFFAAPWWAVGSGPAYVDYIISWASNYGILLGPIAGIMIGNYWTIRQKSYDLQKLYTFGPEGCWYAGGYSKAAFLSLVLTWVACYLIAAPTGQMSYVSGVPFPGGVTWYPAVVLSFIFYVIFARVYKE